MTSRTPLVLALALAACTRPSSGSAPTDAKGDAKIDADVLRRFQTADRQRVIVAVRDPLESPMRPGPARAPRDPDRVQRARRRADLVSRKTKILNDVRRQGAVAEVVSMYPPFASMAIEATTEDVALLAAHPEVRHVYFDAEEAPSIASSGPFIGLGSAHASGANGSGTSVAILDSPIRWMNGSFGNCTQPGGFGCSVGVWISFSGETPEEVMATEDLYDRGSHGTNVAAISLSVAPNTRLLGLNVFYSNHEERRIFARISDQIDALAWVADNADAQNIVAANMSLGGDRFRSDPCNDSSRYEPIRTLLVDYGVLTVISSGNDREQNALSSPACVSPAVSVAAQFDSDTGPYDGSCVQNDAWPGEISCFSNLNGQVDVVAPGVRIDAGGYELSGTSMAAPHVTGAVAALQSRFRSTEGGFLDGYWMHKRLLTDAASPNIHRDGRRFLELDFDGSIQWTEAAAFPTFFRETEAGRIGTSTSAFSATATITGAPFAVRSAYLFLEVEHGSPPDLAVTLTSPDGRSATVSLPGGQANFTGIVGRTFAPGAFASLSGATSTGAWSLTIADGGTGPAGHFLQGALFVTEAACARDCVAEGCGDDRCGGLCGAGACVISGACILDGERNPTRYCEMCNAAADSAGWSAAGDACEIGGTCYLPGTRRPGDACSECRPEISIEQWSLPNDACLVDGRCFAEGEVDPVNPCATCQPATSTRSFTALDAGPCDDGDGCTRADECRSGVCAGDPIVCEAIGQCFEIGVCSPEVGACTDPFKPSGTSCDDGDPCTVADACDLGECAGTLRVCESDDPCEIEGRCSAETGECVFTRRTDGECAPAPPPVAEDDGCGCTTSRERRPTTLGIVALVVLGLRRRRRR